MSGAHELIMVSFMALGILNGLQLLWLAAAGERPDSCAEYRACLPKQTRGTAFSERYREI